MEDSKSVCLTLSLSPEEILSPAIELLTRRGPEVDAYITRILVKRYMCQPSEVTITEYVDHLVGMLKPALEQSRDRNNAHGGCVPKRS